MTNNVTTHIVQVALVIIGVAIVAVLVSNQSNTSGILTAGGSSFGCAIGTALSPITGASGCSGGTSVMSSITFPSLSNL